MVSGDFSSEQFFISHSSEQQQTLKTAPLSSPKLPKTACCRSTFHAARKRTIAGPVQPQPREIVRAQLPLSHRRSREKIPKIFPAFITPHEWHRCWRQSPPWHSIFRSPFSSTPFCCRCFLFFFSFLARKFPAKHPRRSSSRRRQTDSQPGAQSLNTSGDGVPPAGVGLCR